MYQISVLSNGIRVVSNYMPQATSASAFVFFNSGSRHETIAESGISHFIEHMLFRGTTNRPSSQILCGEIESIGGYINGGTDKDFTEFYAKVPADRFPMAVDVLSDMILNSRFDNEDMEKERKVIGEEIAMCYDNHQEWCEVLIDSILWPDHALGRSVAGSVESISTFTSQQLREYQKNHYGSSGTVFSVAGPLKHEETVCLAENLFADLPVASFLDTELYQARQSQSFIYEKRNSEQVHLTIAWPSVNRTDPRRHQIDMLNTLLSGGTSGRLFSEIRDKQGLVYTVESYQMRHTESGAFAVYAATKNTTASQTVAAIIGELKKLAFENIPKDELNKARELVRGRLILRAESTKSMASDYGAQLLLNDEIKDNQQVLKIVESITTQDISECAQWLINQKPKLSAVGSLLNEQEIKNQIDQL